MNQDFIINSRDNLLTCGVYVIFNKINKKMYIGSTANIWKRILDHKNRLIRNCHPNLYLQHAWNKYGQENFVFCYPMPTSNREEAYQLEFWLIDFFESYERDCGYNLERLDNGKRKFHSEETRKKIGIASSKRKLSEETKKKIALASSRRIWSKESREKCSESRLKNVGYSQEVQDLIVEMYSNGEIVKNIVVKTGTSKCYIYRLLKKRAILYRGIKSTQFKAQPRLV
jgi:group I intron endonuclease